MDDKGWVYWVPQTKGILADTDEDELYWVMIGHRSEGEDKVTIYHDSIDFAVLENVAEHHSYTGGLGLSYSQRDEVVHQAIAPYWASNAGKAFIGRAPTVNSHPVRELAVSGALNFATWGGYSSVKSLGGYIEKGKEIYAEDRQTFGSNPLGSGLKAVVLAAPTPIGGMYEASKEKDPIWRAVKAIPHAIALPLMLAGLAPKMPVEAEEMAILQQHLKNAIARFESEGFTAEQQAALIENPGLAAAYRGDRIDSFIKAAVQADERLAHLEVTPRFTFGPDFFDPATQRWWDVTTVGKWQAHVEKYWLFGEGKALITNR